MPVAKKPKHRGHATLLVANVEARVQRALSEGRTQHALELAKQLAKQEPTPGHQELLVRAYLERARQLRSQGHTRDAATVLENAISLGSQVTGWREQIAEEMAASGNPGKALQLLDGLPEGPTRGRILARAADAAVERATAGRELLPEDLRPQLDAVLRAFVQLEEGQDNLVRESLQSIGLQSPFLEWKLLLRGFQAYYGQDDERALENWQRLDVDRLPARLAAPLRFTIDEAYRLAQPPDAQTALQHQADRLLSSGLLPALREIRAALAAEELRRAFHLAGNMLPALRREVPQAVPRLASCFYWAIIHDGQPHDVERYQRLFGAPADDPEFARLRALVLEQMHDGQAAHNQWKHFESTVADHPEAWPGEQANRVRALVWCHMGENAAATPDPDKIPGLPSFLRDHPHRPRPLQPSAEECFRRSLQLAPEQLEPYEALLHYYQDKDQDHKAERAAQQLLERFPDHVPTLVALGNLLFHRGAYTESLDALQSALRLNPLDSQVRARISNAHLYRARTYAEARRFAEARSDYQASLSFSEREKCSATWCKWAACEFKAGDPARAEDLLQQALAEAGSRLAVAFSMVIEAIRLKLPRPLKSRFDNEFKTGLAEPPTPEAAAALADTMASHREVGVTYHGQKTHEKKVLAYLGKAIRVSFTEEQHEKVSTALLNMNAAKLLRGFAAVGQRRFSQNAWFYYVEAESYLAEGPRSAPLWRVEELLNKASELAAQHPHDERQKALLRLIQDRQQLAAMLNPFGPAMSMVNDTFEEFDDGYDDDDDY
jgi:tetratricopeptide (TPR) repeat protein